MSTHRSRILLGLVGAATVAALVVPEAAFAKGGKPTGGESSNNLSVPAIFVNGTPFTTLVCDGTTSTAPTGLPLTGYPLDPTAYYYVQGVNKWQAECIQVTTTVEDPNVTATAQWGDNLSGSAKLKVGSPIRVEIGLYDDTNVPDLTGWEVLKLEPAKLDRESAYGTLATADGLGGYFASPFTSPGDATLDLGTRVWAPGTLKIYAVDEDGLPTGAPPVFEGPAAAEINAKGKVVFGYNLRVTAAGPYVIEYTFPDVVITGTDVADSVISNDGHTVALTITVVAGGGGGRRR